MKIPLFKPFVSKRMMNASFRALSSGKLTRGREVESFEDALSSYLGKKHCVTLNSGTSALHVAVRAMGWTKGDEIITSAFSYIASSNCLLYEGIKPVFADIDPKTLNIDPNEIEKKITRKTKGILLVHIFGLPCNVVAIQKIAAKHGLQIIEDACEAIGRPSQDFPVGQAGSLCVYGFHENKQMTTAGEGGAIATDDTALANACRAMRDQGRASGKDWMSKVTLGFNFRMTETQAAFGKEQLRILDAMLKKRQDLSNEYSKYLSEVRGVQVPLKGQRSWFYYFIRLKSESVRAKLYADLGDIGIASGIHYFPPIYRLGPYKKFYTKPLRHTETASKTLLALPLFYELSKKDVRYICSVLKKSVSSN